MIRSISRTDGIDRLFKSYSEKYIFTGKKILIKINLARPPKDGHPRTDSILMKNVIDFLSEYSNSITLSESTDGYFEKNIQEIGLGEYLKSKKISLLEIDELETIDVLCNNQHIFIPKVFKDYDIRIALPCSSKREEMVYTNNLKLFFGAIPRVYYTEEGKGRARLKLHKDLNNSIINVYNAIQSYSPFQLYINGGNYYSESNGLKEMEEIYLGDDAFELDKYIYEKYFDEVDKPLYLSLYKKMQGEY